MTYVKCPRCGRVMKIFEDSRAKKLVCSCGYEGVLDVCFRETTANEYKISRYRHQTSGGFTTDAI